MQRIWLLSEKVANQIAAGEVVERPASIVKELVENAIDAEATRIQVEIEAGGRSLIRVTDNGFGMSRDDALLALERHATSKIREATDLDSIQSMGFRGEALPSISSISRFSLTTKERGSADPHGTRILVHGGKMIEVQAGTGASGTRVEVRNVFYNLPARRKFLRTAETERSHIHHYLHWIALAYPQIGFTYQHDGKTVWQIPPLAKKAGTDTALDLLLQRYRVLNGDTGNMLRLRSEGVFDVRDAHSDLGKTCEHPVRLWGLIGAPGVSRSTRSDQHLFVNRRPIENHGLNRALMEGYHSILMKGRYPVCCLFLDLSPRFVDVNVHPSKKEVKFRNEFGVRRFTIESVRGCLRKFAHSLHPESQNSKKLASTASTSSPLPKPNEAPLTPSELSSPGSVVIPPASSETEFNNAIGGEFLESSERELPASFPEDRDSSLILETQKTTETKKNQPPALKEPVPLLQVPLRLLGVIQKLYVVFESDRGMVIMDQHAAHERILFEQMMKRMELSDAPSQRLLLPETLELGARDAQFLKEQIKTLGRLGVGISEFGDHTFLLDALPPFAKVPHPRQFMLEVIDQLKRCGEAVNTIRLGEEVIAQTVCRQAVKANDRLQGRELEQLLDALRHCDMPYTCPHGRPTLIEMPCSELEKKFGRAQ